MASIESTPERRLPGSQEDAAERRGRWQARDVADTPPTGSGYSNSCRAARDVWQQTHSAQHTWVPSAHLMISQMSR